MDNIKTTCFNNDSVPRVSVKKALPMILITLALMSGCMYLVVQAI